MYIKILIKINLARQNINGGGIQLVFMHNVSMMNRRPVGGRETPRLFGSFSACSSTFGLWRQGMISTRLATVA